jgi:hypothetical protein
MQLHRIGAVPILPPIFSLCCLDYTIIYSSLSFITTVGNNISNKGDGNAGGQNFMVATDMRSQVQQLFKDYHFMVLGFTAGDGHPIVCAIFIAVSKLQVAYVTDFNPLLKDAEDATDKDMQGLETEIEEIKDEQSNGIGRMFPFGPTCTFNSIEVPMFVTCTKNGSITSELLANMLQRMGDFLLFDRSQGISPFLLCDGHGSRFKDPLL